jgi:hypothetical protein
MLSPRFCSLHLHFSQNDLRSVFVSDCAKNAPFLPLNSRDERMVMIENVMELSQTTVSPTALEINLYEYNVEQTGGSTLQQREHPSSILVRGA